MQNECVCVCVCVCVCSVFVSVNDMYVRTQVSLGIYVSVCQSICVLAVVYQSLHAEHMCVCVCVCVCVRSVFVWLCLSGHRYQLVYLCQCVRAYV